LFAECHIVDGAVSVTHQTIMRILFEPGGGGGGAARVEAIEDIDSAMELLAQRGNIDAGLIATTDERPTSNAQRATSNEDQAKAQAELEERAEEGGRSVEEQAAYEKTDEYKAELAAQELQARATENNRTVEEQQAVDAEEAAKENEAVPEFTDEQKEWLKGQGLVEVDGEWKKEDGTAADPELKEKLEAAEAKARELEEKVAEAGTPQVIATPIHRYFTLDAATLAQEEAKLEEQEAFLMRNWDGIKETEASADGKTPAHPGYTAEQVRQAYTTTKKLREKVLPAAQESLRAHAVENAEARKVYPELFDSKRSEYKTAQDLLKAAPELRVKFPNIMTIIGDAIQGEKARLAKQKTGKGGAASAAVAAAAAAAKAKAAKIPIGAKPASASGKAGATGKGISAARFEELGGDRNALATAIQEGMLNN
jgi:chemotaxis protein histidine kinase CheA